MLDPRLIPQFLNLVDVLPLSSAHASSTSINRVSATFHVALPNSPSRFTQDYGNFGAGEDTNSDKGRHLPSSFSVKSVLGSSDPYTTFVQRLDAKVSYMVQAHLFRDNKLIATSSREIRIFDNGDPQPPICLSDFSSEYVCQQKSSLRKHLFRVGFFSASITEPNPFLFLSGKDSAVIRLPMRFAVRGVEASTNVFHQNAAFNATVIWQLRSSTFMSATPMKSVPTVLQAQRNPSINMITTLGLEHRLTLALNGWNKPSSSLASMQSTDDWMIEQELALSIPTRSLLVPTFFTPHLSRRYSLVVQVKLAGNGKTSVRLEVPVQVVYQNESPGTSRLQSWGFNSGRSSIDQNESLQIIGADAVAELPVYVP